VAVILVAMKMCQGWRTLQESITGLHPFKRLDSILTANEHCDFPATVWAVKIEPFEGSRPGRQAAMSFQWG
jgi:hypothetical protein